MNNYDQRKRENVHHAAVEDVCISEALHSLFVCIELSCTVIGSLFIVSAVVLINRHRQLRNKPIKMHLFGICFSYLLFFVTSTHEFIYWDRTESKCRADVVVFGVPHVFVFLNVFLALIDRLVAINHADWYQINMTEDLAFCIIIISSTLSVLVMQFFYPIALGFLPCEISFIRANVNGILLTFTCVAGIVLYLTVRKKINHLTRTQKRISSTPILEFSNFKKIKKMHRESRNRWEYSINDDVMNEEVKDRGILSEIQIEITRILLTGVRYLIFMAFIAVVWVSVFFVGQPVNDDLKCNYINWTEPFLKILLFVYALYGSMVFFNGLEELKPTIFVRIFNLKNLH
ncbi:hypothetical protein GHT06_019214 [Daphnia sinensis]|uniref:G-protein coupled receptors family 1 profile domain-containing protein n=1 Tax=Daphnia sinensis TaxID=1820382 RepID=A0AAD5L1G1_9CRUS|nr:hypothetical protein GHT06_019214 [Daphnia sinensis]